MSRNPLADEAFTTTVTEVKTLPNPFSSVSFYATDDVENAADGDLAAN